MPEVTHKLSQENRDQTCRPYLGSGKQAQPAHPSCVFVRCRRAGSETKCITHSQPKIAPGSYLCSRYIEEEGHAICLSTLIAVTSTASSLLRSQSSPKKLVHRMYATYFFLVVPSTCTKRLTWFSYKSLRDMCKAASEPSSVNLSFRKRARHEPPHAMLQWHQALLSPIANYVSLSSVGVQPVRAPPRPSPKAVARLI